MAFENFPTVLQPIFQQNMLDRRFQEQLKMLGAYRKSVYRLPVEKRNGETMIYSRAGRIAPVLDDIVPSTNTGLDNGLTGIGGVGAGNPTYPFEQFAVGIGMRPYFLDLNLIQEKEVIADLFKQNVDNLAENAALSLDLYAMQTAFTAYLSGNSFALGASATSGGNTTVHMDNVYGLDKAFATVTINGATFPYGLPAAVSPSNPLAATLYPAAGGSTAISIIGIAYDGGNVSTLAGLQLGASGTITIQGTAVTLAEGDVVVASDAPSVFRPNGKESAYALDATDTVGAQLILNAVAELRANGVKPPLGNGTYPCYIDPLVDAQFFTDPQYQIMSQGQFQSPDFHNGRVSQNFGVTFVPTTNAPSFSLTNHASQPIHVRHLIVTGDKYVQESPFAGTMEAIRSMPDMGVADYRFVDDIVMVNRLPLDRAGQIMSMGWYYIGGFVAPTDATINSTVVPSASAARYKRAAVVQVAAQR
jgi:hypothetical protein